VNPNGAIANTSFAAPLYPPQGAAGPLIAAPVYMGIFRSGTWALDVNGRNNPNNQPPGYILAFGAPKVVVPKNSLLRLFIDSDLQIRDSVDGTIETKRPSTLMLSSGNQDTLLFKAKVL